ncbi:MAG: catalase [Actinomycetia bacterium]|nr:catalase [Actinomycetes bacterium]
MVDPLAEQAVDALQAVTGAHPGMRAAHAKGTLCAATFTPSPEASSLSRAAHFAGGPVRAHVRFSNGSGDPTAPDYAARDGRGLAAKFYLDGGATTDIVAVTLPAFFVRTPEDFLAFARARRPDPTTGEPDMDAIGAFLADHPEAMTAAMAVVSALPPESYLRCAYNALHAFRFVDAGGGSRFIRYRFEPDAGEATLTADDAETRGADYLQHDLAARLADRPATFTLTAQIGTDEDPHDDPTAVWPDDRTRVTLGRLDVGGLAYDREQAGDVLVFDPTRVTDGIELSDDPILAFRSKAYGVSVARRTRIDHAET